ncbi:intradiol ring-cleavage dioxygenase [Rubrobacter marinus]|uniref:intradiol ring-cleavage dioxygenase n=1 Tax=Rubrobacter marinus TaxID=2653852 RepID=UPI001A9CC317|nr:intradiol ring-cleavage dioxygenase [Rubrobacter marinus]
MQRDGERELRTSRKLSRRQMLGFTAAAAAATLAGCGPVRSGTVSAGQAGTTAAGGATAVPSCLLTPEVTEGPYYLDLTQIRKDVTEGKPGLPMRLRTTVVDTANDCQPLENAAVDIWHCDAVGVYSGFTQQSLGQGGAPAGPPPPPPGGQYGTPPEAGGPEAGNMAAEPTDDETFLRGVQLTNADGIAEFDTIYPGWYAGRALHIHLKVHVGGRASGDTYEGGHVSHTGQLFFPEDVTAQVATLEPYSSHGEVPIVSQAEDGIFQGPERAPSSSSRSSAAPSRRASPPTSPSASTPTRPRTRPAWAPRAARPPAETSRAPAAPEPASSRSRPVRGAPLRREPRPLALGGRGSCPSADPPRVRRPLAGSQLFL